MRETAVKYKKFLISFLILAITVTSCDKINESPIPEVYVNLPINLNITNELTIPGSSVYFPGIGFGGVIVTCFSYGEWYAYDAACTYEVSPNCTVKEDGGIAECPCCGSRYVLIGGGYTVKAPASVPLKQYHVSLVNNFTLRVYN